MTTSLPYRTLVAENLGLLPRTVRMLAFLMMVSTRQVRVMAELGPCKSRRASRNAAPATAHRAAARSRSRVPKSDRQLD